jgi:hypothetical protein
MVQALDAWYAAKASDQPPVTNAQQGNDNQGMLDTSDLRGVTYAFNMMGDTSASYDMSLHADYMHFRLSEAATAPLSDRYTMRWTEFGTTSELTARLKLSALASGAFPIGLAPRLLDHIPPGNSSNTGDYYSARTWPVPTPGSAGPH